MKNKISFLKLLFNNFIIILINIFGIIKMLIKRQLMPNKVRKDKRIEKKRHNNEIRFSDIKKDSIKDNIIENIAADINFLSVFIIQFLMTINFYN